MSTEETHLHLMAPGGPTTVIPGRLEDCSSSFCQDAARKLRRRQGRRPKARPTQVILGALDENVRMLLRDADSEIIGARIAELLEELGRSMGGRDEEPEA